MNLGIQGDASMRRVTDVSKIDNARIEPRDGFAVLHRDPIEPEPVGTIVLLPFRVTGYDRDCDRSLMARLEGIDADGIATGWNVNRVGIANGVVVTLDELKELGESS